MNYTVVPESESVQDSQTQQIHHHEDECTCNIELGPEEFYDLITEQYAHDPDDLARSTWMQALIDEHKDWIGLKSAPDGDVKVLDYCAGTGIMSRALAPYANKIVGMDFSKNMTIQYEKMVEQTLVDHPMCLMMSVQGDMVHNHSDPIGIPLGFMPFDIVAICLGVDLFAPSAALHDHVPSLIRALGSLISRMAEGGTLLVLEVEKEYDGCEEHEGPDEDYDAKWQHSMHSSKKIVSHGSREVCAALEASGMEDIEVKGDLWYEEPSEGGQIYFLLKARKGDGYHGPAAVNDKGR